MNLESILEQVLSFAGTFSPKLVIFLFLICAIGEFAVPIPYLLDTTWLLSGYHLATGTLSPLALVFLLVAAQSGRLTGVTLLYYMSRFGSTSLMKLYQKHLKTSLPEKKPGNDVALFKLLQRIDLSSPFSVALGRLLWLRLPLTLTMAIKRQPRTLLLGVLLSSVVWDGIYISLGVVGRSVALKPIQMLLYSLIGLTLLYLVAFLIRRLLRR